MGYWLFGAIVLGLMIAKGGKNVFHGNGGNSSGGSSSGGSSSGGTGSNS